MALIIDNLKQCGVKVSAYVCGVHTFGSGVVYETPNFCEYNYVLTAKHILQEDSKTPFSFDKITNLCIHFNKNGKLSQLATIRKTALKDSLIIFEDDFLIIIIPKEINVNFKPILVSNSLENSEKNFFSWSVFSANQEELNSFKFERADAELKRLKLKDNVTTEALDGMSGAGIFIDDKNILYGIISRYPNDNCENKVIECSQISFVEVNAKLKSIGKIELDTKQSALKKEVNGNVVDIRQAKINNVILDIELAKRRLKTDIIDDWFHDPLRYIDLLDDEYLFKQFQTYFDTLDYEASKAESFYVPKKKFTLRQALISPFIDRIMYMGVVGVLAEKLDSAMIPTVYSARYNKFNKKQLILNGVEQWKKMQYALAEKAHETFNNNFKYNCVLEIDLLNFYDNISKDLLIKKIERVCESSNEKHACKLLGKMLNNFSTKDEGLPQNSDASSLLASFYLNQVDIFMQNNSFAYFRFMDDIRIFCKDKYEARRILQIFEYELRRCHLSVNSQKTKIITITDNNDIEDEGVIVRDKLDDLFDLELNKIHRLRNSSNQKYLKDAFHLSIKLLIDNISEDLNASEESSRKLNYALNTFEFLGKNKIELISEGSEFEDALNKAIRSLKDAPWMTTQLCKVLNLLATDLVKEKFLSEIIEILLNSKYNTYSFQTFQLWLLLAKHKCATPSLIKYAVDNIEKNDETNKAVIAAMIIYVCSVDKNYKRVIARKFSEEFSHGYFQNRISLIALRAFDLDIIYKEHIHESLIYSQEFTNKHKDRDLVFIPGFDENSSSIENFEQLYSL